jgi:hypothetical protein
MPAVLLLVLVSSFFGWPLLEGGHIAFYISQSLLVAFLLWREAARGSFAMRAVCLFGVAIEVVEALRWVYFYVFSPDSVPGLSYTAWSVLVALVLYLITNKQNGSN